MLTSCLGRVSSCCTAAAISGLFATSTMRRTPPDLISANFAGIRTAPAITAGISRVRRMNDLERTRSRYSRWITIQTLYIFPHHTDEDLFQRRLHRFETADARLIRGLSQQLLGVGSRLQADFDVIAIVVE